MNLPLVIEPGELAQHLNAPKLLVIDLSSSENYQRGHIPGAIHMDASKLLCGSSPVPNKLPSEAQLSTLFSSLGITENHHVVVYDDQMGPLAGRMIWTLNCCGHYHCSFLNGQLPAWLKDGQPLESEPNIPEASEYTVRIDNHCLADIDYILQHLNTDDHTILDVRSAEEYRGEKVINAKKGGHIPGAVNYEWTRALISGDDLRLRPAEEILDELAALGVTPDKTVITHCQTHRRSGLSYLFTKHLGFKKVRCYDGSWFEWGNLPETPVEK